MRNSPLAKPSECAIHFLILDVVFFAGRKRVQHTFLSLHSRSVSMLSRLPLAMITSIPSCATLRAMLHLVSIPPRPNDDFPDCMYFESSVRVSADISGMIRLLGSLGFPSYIPSMLLRIIKASAPIMVAIMPESSSLSVNINSVTDTVSFSLTMGMTPFSSMTSMQCFWLR